MKFFTNEETKHLMFFLLYFCKLGQTRLKKDLPVGGFSQTPPADGEPVFWNLPPPMPEGWSWVLVGCRVSGRQLPPASDFALINSCWLTLQHLAAAVTDLLWDVASNRHFHNLGWVAEMLIFLKLCSSFVDCLLQELQLPKFSGTSKCNENHMKTIIQCFFFFFYENCLAVKLNKARVRLFFLHLQLLFAVRIPVWVMLLALLGLWSL